MSSEAGFGTAAVRYASVGAGFRGPSGPPTVVDRPRTGTDQPTAEARKATDGADGSSYTHRPPRFFPLTWHFRMPEHYRRLLVTGLGLAGLLARLADSAALPSVYRQSHDLVD
jgi:hypothetical protein